jgi:hypothetical protein
MSRPICGACNRNVKVTSSPVKRSQHSVSSDRELPTPTNSPRPYSPSSPTPINNHMLASDYQDVQQDEGRKEEREGINFDNIASIRDIVSISKRQINEILKADNNALAKKILKHQLDLMNKLESMESFQMSPSAPNLTTASTVMPVMMMNVENVSPVTRLSECLYTELNRPTQNWDKSMTHIKWSLGKMIGNLAGTGEIQDLDFDDYGYPKHVLISGTCITNEHKLLPKVRYFMHIYIDNIN